MKKNFIILITVGLIGAVYLIQEVRILSIKNEKNAIEKAYCKGTWNNGVCLMKTCVDSDVNEKPNDIYIKGKVTYTNEQGVSTVVNDECTGSNLQLHELWCYEMPEGSGNYVQGDMVYDCPRGCLDGACIK